jgi:3-phosphoinositide dependent protein kinase-1
MREKDVLLKIRPNERVVLLHKTFQDTSSLYFLMSYCCNEDIFFWLQRYGSFNIDVASYYSAQIVEALGYIHSKGVVHRDLKPENILLDQHMAIKLADFGCAKMAPSLGGKLVWDAKASSFVGTAEYVAPEILNSQPCGPPADFWSLGCIVFRFLAGRVPFYAPNDYLIFQRIENMDFTFPEVSQSIILSLNILPISFWFFHAVCHLPIHCFSKFCFSHCLFSLCLEFPTDGRRFRALPHRCRPC